jgi:ABC-type Fe3+-siderophore transport system permease subunit
MYFGAAILVISMVLFELNKHVVTDPEQATIVDMVNALIGLSVLLLGVPYFVRITWKRRERLIGEEINPTQHTTIDQEG